MTRVFFIQFVFFLLPFAVYAAILVARQRNPARWDNWSKHVSWLILAGLGCVIFALLVTGVFAERETRTWVLSRIEDGRVVPRFFK